MQHVIEILTVIELQKNELIGNSLSFFYWIFSKNNS